jgi:hypothetical protein
MNRKEMKLRIRGMENQLSSQSWKTPSDNNVFLVIHSAIDSTIKNAQHVLQALRRLLLPCRRLNSLSNMNAFNILMIVLTILFAIPSCNIIEDIISDTKSTKRISKIKIYRKHNEKDSTIMNFSYTDNRLSQIHSTYYYWDDGLIADEPVIVLTDFAYKEDSVIITKTNRYYKDDVSINKYLLNKNNYINYYSDPYLDYDYSYKYNYSQNGYLQSMDFYGHYSTGNYHTFFFRYDKNWNLIETFEYLFSSYTDIPNLSGIYVFTINRQSWYGIFNFAFGLYGKAPAYLPKEGQNKYNGDASLLFDYELDKEGYVKKMIIEASSKPYIFYEYFYE